MGSDGPIVLTGEAIEFARMLAIRSRLGLELKGLRFKPGPRTLLRICREDYGFVGRTKEEAWHFMDALIERVMEERKHVQEEAVRAGRQGDVVELSERRARSRDLHPS